MDVMLPRRIRRIHEGGRRIIGRQLECAKLPFRWPRASLLFLRYEPKMPAAWPTCRRRNSHLFWPLSDDGSRDIIGLPFLRRGQDFDIFADIGRGYCRQEAVLRYANAMSTA